MGIPNIYLYDINARTISVGILRYKYIRFRTEAAWVNA